jgi:hypothetical protein
LTGKAPYKSGANLTFGGAAASSTIAPARAISLMGGTEGSNLAASSGESGANLTFGYESQIRE